MKEIRKEADSFTIYDEYGTALASYAFDLEKTKRRINIL